MTPTASRTASSLTRAASSQPAPTPIIEAGMRISEVPRRKVAAERPDAHPVLDDEDAAA